MSYGVNTRWGATNTRARRATSRSSKKRRSKAPRRSNTASARRAPKKRKKSGKKKSTRSSKRRAGTSTKKAKLYNVYDPIDGTKLKVTKDDPRYDLWPHRKPSKKAKARSRLEALGVSAPVAAVVQTVGTSAARRATSVASRTAKKVGAAVLATAGLSNAALIAVAGVAAYFATKSLQEHYQSEDERRAGVALAYKHARSALAEKLGRGPYGALTPEENAALAVKFREELERPSRTQTGRFGRI